MDSIYPKVGTEEWGELFLNYEFDSKEMEKESMQRFMPMGRDQKGHFQVHDVYISFN